MFSVTTSKFALQQLVQMQARRAFREFEANGRGVEIGDRDRGGLIEAEGGAAEGKLGAPISLGCQPVTGSQRPVGQGGRRDFLLALERDLALDVRQARDALRRLAEPKLEAVKARTNKRMRIMATP